MENVERTIISQYDTAPSIVTLIQAFNQWIDPRADIDAFYNLVWNVDTAVGEGLNIWGRIVGVGRNLNVAATKYFGFDEAGTVSADPFGQSPFYSGQRLTDAILLDDAGFRSLILAKALANICDGSIPDLNQLLINLFPGRGNVYVTDGGDMTMTYTFTFHPTPVEAAIVVESGILPKPSGVSATVVEI